MQLLEGGIEYGTSSKEHRWWASTPFCICRGWLSAYGLAPGTIMSILYRNNFISIEKSAIYCLYFMLIKYPLPRKMILMTNRQLFHCYYLLHALDSKVPYLRILCVYSVHGILNQPKCELKVTIIMCRVRWRRHFGSPQNLVSSVLYGSPQNLVPSVLYGSPQNSVRSVLYQLCQWYSFTPSSIISLLLPLPNQFSFMDTRKYNVVFPLVFQIVLWIY